MDRFAKFGKNILPASVLFAKFTTCLGPIEKSLNNKILKKYFSAMHLL